VGYARGRAARTGAMPPARLRLADRLGCPMPRPQPPIGAGRQRFWGGRGRSTLVEESCRRLDVRDRTRNGVPGLGSAPCRSQSVISVDRQRNERVTPQLGPSWYILSDHGRRLVGLAFLDPVQLDADPAPECYEIDVVACTPAKSGTITLRLGPRSRSSSSSTSGALARASIQPSPEIATFTC
jgi:hypothetical protein